MPSLAFTTRPPQTHFDFSRPLGEPPDAASAICLLHRDPAAWMTIARGDDGPRDVAALRPCDVETMLPGMFDWLVENAYVSINAFAGPQTLRQTKHGTLSPFMRGRSIRTKAGAARLNSAFIDVDHLPFETGQQTIRQAVDDGIIPMPSIVADSGRGTWAFWILSDDRNSPMPPQADEQARLRYESIHNALQGRLRDRLPTLDPKSKDVARLTRIPGSINGKAGRKVRWFPLTDSPRYTMSELAAGVGVPESVRPAIEALLQRPIPAPRPARESRPSSGRFQVGHGYARRGAVARWLRQLDNFEALRQLRGGFRQGHREQAAFCFGVIMRRLGLAEDTIVSRVGRMAAECVPPLDAREQEHAIASSRRHVSPEWRPQRNAWFATVLDVTEDERPFLPTWPSADGRRRRADQQRRSRFDVAARRKAIRAIVRDLGYVPTVRDMVLRLAAIADITVTRSIVGRDYHALNIRSGSTRGGRRIPQTLLPLRADISSAGRVN